MKRAITSLKQFMKMIAGVRLLIVLRHVLECYTNNPLLLYMFSNGITPASN